MAADENRDDDPGQETEPGPTMRAAGSRQSAEFAEPPGMFGLPGNDGVNESERLLTALCRRSFLRLWVYTNLYTDEGRRPGKNATKELCDALAVFGNDVLIFSDKHIEFQVHKELDVAWSRWYRRAVKESVKQLWGAKAWVSRFPERAFLDANCTRTMPVALPQAKDARYHLIAVTRGTRDAARRHFSDEIGSLFVSTDVVDDAHLKTPFVLGRIDASRGFVHVFDEAAIEILMSELDTVYDFVGYLKRREVLLGDPKMIVHAAGEEQLLAAYLTTMGEDDEHTFVRFEPGKARPTVLMFDNSHYAHLQANPRYQAKKRSDEASRGWDELIDVFTTYGDPTVEIAGISSPPAEVERALRFMAGESRFRRRILSSVVRQAIRLTPPGRSHTRLYAGSEQPNPAYVIVVASKLDDETYDEYRERRRMNLAAYCRVAKLPLPNSSVFVGIGIDHPIKDYPGKSEDLFVYEQRVWNDEVMRETERIRDGLQILGERQTVSHASAQEFPDVDRHQRTGARGFLHPKLHIDTEAPRGKRPNEKKVRDKMKAKSQRRNRPKKK